MEKLILTDADSVLLNWEDHFHAWMHSQGHERVQNMNSYWQESHYPGLSQDEARKQVFYFNTSAWLLTMPPYLDAVSGVQRLVDNGFKFHVITAMGLDEAARQARIINLNNLFGKDTFVEVTVTDMYDHTSKEPTLSKYKDSGLYWIEDRADNANLGAKLGLKSLLMNHMHNENEELHPAVKRVDDWAAICSTILND